jgi:hypothetical protein
VLAIVSVLIGHPGIATASWIPEEAVLSVHTSRKATSAGDFDGDGANDLLVPICSSDSPEVLVVFGPFNDREITSGSNASMSITYPPQAEGCSVTRAGDVNGDQLHDVLIGLPGKENTRGEPSGVAYVVFGSEPRSEVDLSRFDDGTQGEAGFKLEGASTSDRLGEDVAGLSDMNEDGRDDLLLGAPFGGSAYVVFGKEDPLPVDLSLFHLGPQATGGFRVRVPIANRNDRFSVAGLGDVNGDELPDLAVGVIASLHGRGVVHVVFGKASTELVDVKATASQGFRVIGPHRDATAGYAVASVGDTNNDGNFDIGIGAPASTSPNVNAGKAFVVFGKQRSGDIFLGRRLGINGLKFEAPRDSKAEAVGYSLAGVGDANGDGFADLVIGAPRSDFGSPGSGSVFLMFGRRQPGAIKLVPLGSQGIRMDGPRSTPTEYALAGSYLSSGDITNDGIEEIFVGASRINSTFILAVS